MKASHEKSDSLISNPSDDDAQQKQLESSIQIEYSSTPLKNVASIPKKVESLSEFTSQDKFTPEGFHLPKSNLQGVAVSLPDFETAHPHNTQAEQLPNPPPPNIAKEMSCKKSKAYPHQYSSARSLGHLATIEEKDIVIGVNPSLEQKESAVRMYSAPKNRFQDYRENSNLPGSTQDVTKDIPVITEQQEETDALAREKWKNLLKMRRPSKDIKNKGSSVNLSIKQMELLHDFELYHEQNLKYFMKNLRNARIPNSVKGSLPHMNTWQIDGSSPKAKTFWDKLKSPILPNSTFRILWDFLVVILVFLDLIVLPLQISFDLLNSLYPLDYITFGIFVLDIFLNFHTAYFEYGTLVTDHTEIAKKYARSWLAIDLIAAFPFFVLNNIGPELNSRRRVYQAIRLVKIVRIARLFKLRKVTGRVSASLINSQSRNFWELVKLFLVALLVAHWIASIWHFIAVVEIEQDFTETWLGHKDLVDATAYFRYVNSFYWAITTMLTVGYGDITPVTSAEIWFAAFTMIIGCGFFAFTISTVSNIVNEIQQQKSKRRSKIIIINRFMAKYNMSKEVQLRIRSYIEYLLEEESNKKQDQEEFMNIMPESIKREVLIDLNGVLLSKNSVLSMHFETPFLMDLATKLKEKTLGPEENVYNDDDPDNSFYIITKGKIDLYLRKTNQSLKVLTVGDHFGHISFFSNKKRHVGAMSVFFSHVCYLKKKTFLKRVERRPKEREIYCYIRDKINFCNDYSIIKQSCYACGNDHHVISECPDMQYIPDPQDIATLVLLEEQEFRQNFVRKPRRRFHALKDQSNLVQEIEKFNEDTQNFPSLQLARGNTASKKFNHEDSISQNISKGYLDTPKKIREPSGYELNIADLSIETDISHFAEIDEHSNRDEGEHDLDESQSSTGGSKRRKRQCIILDKMKSYQIYFPHNNVDNVIRRINRINELETKPAPPLIPIQKKRLFSQAAIPKISSPTNRQLQAVPMKYSNFWKRRDGGQREDESRFKPIEEEHAHPSTRNTLDLEFHRDGEHGNEPNETPKSQTSSLWTIPTAQ